jgi:hypothetical protein
MSSVEWRNLFDEVSRFVGRSRYFAFGNEALLSANLRGPCSERGLTQSLPAVDLLLNKSDAAPGA